MDFRWEYPCESVDWDELTGLYRVAPLGEKTAAGQQTCFANSKYICLVYDQDKLIAAGRELAASSEVYPHLVIGVGEKG